MLLGGGLHVPNDDLERFGCRLHAFGGDDLVGSRETDERDGRMAMLTLERAYLQQLRAQWRRDGNFERDALDGREGLDGPVDPRRGPEEPSSPLLLPDGVAVEEGGRLRADEDLTGLRRRLHLHRACRGRPGDEELAVGLADEEELEGPAVQSGVHPELDRAGRRPRPSDRAKRPAHLERRPRRPRSMVVAVVQQQERVAAELQKPAALRVGDAEQSRERRVHHLGDLLRAGSPETGESLRHRREARDVDERERAVHLEPGLRRVVAQPLERQPGDEGDELGGQGRTGRSLGHLAIVR